MGLFTIGLVLLYQVDFERGEARVREGDETAGLGAANQQELKTAPVAEGGSGSGGGGGYGYGTVVTSS